MPLTTDEQERHAYAQGATREAELLARIDALQRALGQAVAALDAIANTRGTNRPATARATIDLIKRIV